MKRTMTIAAALALAVLATPAHAWITNDETHALSDADRARAEADDLAADAAYLEANPPPQWNGKRWICVGDRQTRCIEQTKGRK